ncbi:cell division protein FtsQ [Swaminathania salitolerans LMG 21291]|nr:cell division protein FtsQ [Swaminathania salitolerans LMG 21291]
MKRREDMPTRGAMNQDRPSRLVLFVRRHRRGLRTLLGLSFVLVLCLAGAAALRLSTSDLRFAPYRAKLVQYIPFRIQTIRVEGRSLTGENELMNALGTTVGQPIFGFSVSAARDRIDALPFVDHATVERHMPDTVVIKIVERSPIAVWQDRGRFILINRAGEKVPDQGLEGKNGQAFLKLPLVVGEGANTAASALVDALNAHPDVRAFVIAATRIGQRRWTLTLRDGTSVLLPEGREDVALGRLGEYQTRFRLLERPVTSIDMRLPDRMIIHQAPGSQGASSASGQKARPESAPPSSSSASHQTRHPSSPSPDGATPR